MAPAEKRGANELSYDYDVEGEEEDGYEVYVPLKKRREEQLKKLAGKRVGGGAGRRGKGGEGEEDEDGDGEQKMLTPEELEEIEREKKRKEQTLLAAAQEVKAKKALEGGCQATPGSRSRSQHRVTAGLGGRKACFWAGFEAYKDLEQRTDTTPPHHLALDTSFTPPFSYRRPEIRSAEEEGRGGQDPRGHRGKEEAGVGRRTGKGCDLHRAHAVNVSVHRVSGTGRMRSSESSVYYKA